MSFSCHAHFGLTHCFIPPTFASRSLHHFICSSSRLWYRFCLHHFQIPRGVECTPLLFKTLTLMVHHSQAVASEVDRRLEKHIVTEANLQKQLESTECALQKARAELAATTALQAQDALIVREREQLFHSIVAAKLHQSTTGLVTAQGMRGRPITLMRVALAEKPSDDAHRDTVKRRSRMLENVHRIISSSSSADRCSGEVAQQADLIRRNQAPFLAAANKAGLKIFAKFRIDQIAALSAEMSLSTIALLKKMFNNAFGVDPFASLADIRKKREELSFDYECGSFDDDDKKAIQFLRVTNIPTVLQKTVNTLKMQGKLQYLPCCKPGELRLLIQIDKGGGSTKLVLQILNCSHRHSTRTARLLAFFQGDETYSNMHTVFVPVISSLFAVAAQIENLCLPAPSIPTTTLPANRSKKRESSTFQKLKNLGIASPEENTTISEDCRLCRSHGQRRITTSSKPEQVDSCTVTVGGDWISQSTILGLTGPKGKHFCNFCLATLSDLKKGIPQTPLILPRYGKHQAVAQTFNLRTFEDMSSDYDRYVAAGSCKANASQFNNCINRALVPGEGSVLSLFSCTPLHIFLGLADQALKLVESEAAVLDEEVKAQEGVASPELQMLIADRNAAEETCNRATEESERARAAVEEATAAVTAFQQEHNDELRCENGVFTCTTKKAKQHQKDLRNLQKNAKQAQLQQMQADRQALAMRKQLESENTIRCSSWPVLQRCREDVKETKFEAVCIPRRRSTGK